MSMRKHKQGLLATRPGLSILVKAGAHFIFRLTRQGIMVFYSLDSERRDASGKVKESPCTSA